MDCGSDEKCIADLSLQAEPSVKRYVEEEEYSCPYYNSMSTNMYAEELLVVGIVPPVYAGYKETPL